MNCNIYVKTRSRLFWAPIVITCDIDKLTKKDIDFIATSCKDRKLVSRYEVDYYSLNISYNKEMFYSEPCLGNVIKAACRYSFRMDDDIAIIYNKRRHCVSIYDPATHELLMEEFVR